jgi:branched-chain amino acid transport system permease protein
MILFFQLAATGLALGGIYAIVAVGFSLTFATSRTVNFSQGQSAMIGAVLYYWLRMTLGVQPVLAFLVVILAGAVLGLVIALTAIFPFVRSQSRTEHGWLLSTIALGIVLENIALFTFGSEARALPPMFSDKPIAVLGIGILPHELTLIVAAIGMAIIVDLLLYRTLYGKIFRAVATNPPASRLIGIDSSRMIAVSYALSTSLAAAAGVLIAPLVNVSASMGTIIGIKAFAIAAVSGMLRPVSIFILGLCFGIVESLVAGYLGLGARDTMAFGSLILLLAWRPFGFSERWQRQV